MITEPERVRYDKHMVDDVLYSGEDWELAEAMKKSLRMEARHDPFLAQVLAKAETQRFMVNKNQCFQYGNFKYTPRYPVQMGLVASDLRIWGDLKSTLPAHKKQFDEAIDFFRLGPFPRLVYGYRRQSAGISSMVSPRKIKKCSKHSLNEGDTIYQKGKEKYEELAFRWWMLFG